MKKKIILIAIIVLISIIILTNNRKNTNQGFTGTIYTINYCDERERCDEVITIGEEIVEKYGKDKLKEIAISLMYILHSERVTVFGRR